MPAASHQSMSCDADEVDAAARLDHQPIAPARVPGAPVPAPARRAAASAAARPPSPALGEVLARVRERRLEPLGAERLQQVVERVDFERAQRVLVVRRHEHDRRHVVRRACAPARSRPSPASGRRGTPDRATCASMARDGLRPGRALADDLDVRLRRAAATARARAPPARRRRRACGFCLVMRPPRGSARRRPARPGTECGR